MQKIAVHNLGVWDLSMLRIFLLDSLKNYW